MKCHKLLPKVKLYPCKISSKEDGLCWEEVGLRGNSMYDQGSYPYFFLVWYLSFAIGHAILHTFIDIFAKQINLGVFKNQRKKTNSRRPSEMVRLYWTDREVKRELVRGWKGKRLMSLGVTMHKRKIKFLSVLWIEIECVRAYIDIGFLNSN